MGTSFLIIFRWSYFLMIVALWAYFFTYSYHHRVSRPWGFGIVIVGVLISGYGYVFYVTQAGFFSINFLFLVSLFGILWNINNIREQVYIRNIGEFLRFLGIGLIFGLLFGFSQIALLGFEYFRIDTRFTPIALIASVTQSSIGEEILYRGYFLSYLRKYGFKPKYAIVVQSLIFTAIHVLRYSSNWVALFTIFLVGIVASYLTWKNNNLIPAIILHVVSNVVGIIWWLAVT